MWLVTVYLRGLDAGSWELFRCGVDDVLILADVFKKIDGGGSWSCCMVGGSIRNGEAENGS